MVWCEIRVGGAFWPIRVMGTDQVGGEDPLLLMP